MQLRIPRCSVWRWLLIWSIVLYVVICSLLFFAYVKPSFLGQNQLRIGADSQTYLAVAGVVHDSGVDPATFALVSFEGNLLGPVLIARLVPSLTGIAVVYITIFILCLLVANSLPGVRLGRFFWLMILNPLTTPSILTVNKELLSALAVILLVKYVSMSRRSSLLLVAVLGTALMARWEQMLVTAIFLVLEHKGSPFRGRRWTVLALVIGGITLIYPILVKTQLVNVAALISMAEGTVIPRLNEIQASYGFPLIVVPKIIINLWGQVLHPSYFWTDYLNGDFSDIQNYFAIPFHCVAMFAICIIAIVCKKLDIRKDTIYWMAIYVVTTAATPLFQPRYQFPIYVILALEVSGISIRSQTQQLPHTPSSLTSPAEA